MKSKSGKLREYWEFSYIQERTIWHIVGLFLRSEALSLQFPNPEDIFVSFSYDLLFLMRDPRPYLFGFKQTDTD